MGHLYKYQKIQVLKYEIHVVWKYWNPYAILEDMEGRFFSQVSSINHYLSTWSSRGKKIENNPSIWALHSWWAYIPLPTHQREIESSTQEEEKTSAITWQIHTLMISSHNASSEEEEKKTCPKLPHWWETPHRQTQAWCNKFNLYPRKPSSKGSEVWDKLPSAPSHRGREEIRNVWRQNPATLYIF